MYKSHFFSCFGFHMFLGFHTLLNITCTDKRALGLLYYIIKYGKIQLRSVLALKISKIKKIEIRLIWIYLIFKSPSEKIIQIAFKSFQIHFLVRICLHFWEIKTN